MKQCPKCLNHLPLSSFHKHAGRSDGLQSYCKDCKRSIDQIHHKKYQSSGRKALLIKNRKEEVWASVLTYLHENGCHDCGFRNVLTLEFHHLDSSTKESEVSLLIRNGASKERIWDEIQKCQILCANCHRIRTYSNSKIFRFRWSLQSSTF